MIDFILSNHYPYSCWVSKLPFAIFAFKQFNDKDCETLRIVQVSFFKSRQLCRFPFASLSYLFPVSSIPGYVHNCSAND